MSGRLTVLRQKRPLDHAHFVFALDNGYYLHFIDARKFGRVKYLGPEADVDAALGLGIEPLSAEFTAQSLQALAAASPCRIKTFLLDQKKIAGIGNIYSDEALWRARIHPLRRANTLSPKETAALREAIVEVLRLGIKENGAAIDWVYPGGHFQDSFQVYAKEGQACARCGTKIRRIIVGQRGSRFCPTCQREKRK
jgi:formamidopyrimidine-DNA glycosylase